MVVLDAACHSHTVLFCVRFEPSDLLTSLLKLVSEVKSQVNHLQIQVMSRVEWGEQVCKLLLFFAPRQLDMELDILLTSQSKLTAIFGGVVVSSSTVPLSKRLLSNVVAKSDVVVPWLKLLFGV